MSSTHSIGAMNQLADALDTIGYTPDDVTKLRTSGVLGEALKLMAGTHKLVFSEVPKPEPVPEPALDFTIRMDRSVKPIYPSWVKKLENPELECSGPTEYNLQTEVVQWLHEDQKHGYVVGDTIYKSLQEGKALATCLNLQDGLAIQAKGIALFRKLFAGKAVFLWGSVVQNSYGLLSVPYLYEDSGKVVVDWGWLGRSWSSYNPALRFSKKN